MIFPLSLMLFNNIAYRHQHILFNGITIEHAHPFKPCSGNCGNGSGHQHTENELLLYTLITDSPVFLFFSLSFLVVYRNSESDLNIPLTLRYYRNSPVLYCFLRAPPLY